MGNNKRFDTILDECLESLLTGKETVEQCLQRYPEYAAELEPLLRTAMIVNKAVDVKPSADFRAKARYQLQTVMAKSQAPKRTRIFVPRWAVAVCAVMLVFVLGGGTVLAANGSMPGSPLYSVKLATEDLSIKLAGSEEEKVELYAAIADRRVTEMTWMVDNGKTDGLEASVQRLNNDYVKIGELPLVNSTETAMFASESSSASSLPAPMITQTPTTLTSQSGNSGSGNAGRTTVKTTKPDTTVATTTATTTTPIAAPTVVVPAPTIIVTIPSNAAVAHGNNANNTVNGNNVSKNSTLTASANDIAKLKNTLSYYAVIHPEKIQELLDSDKVPESVKPALQQALAASKAGYQQAISNLSP